MYLILTLLYFVIWCTVLYHIVITCPGHQCHDMYLFILRVLYLIIVCSIFLCCDKILCTTSSHHCIPALCYHGVSCSLLGWPLVHCHNKSCVSGHYNVWFVLTARLVLHVVPENNVQYFIIMTNSVLDQCDISYTSLSWHVWDLSSHNNLYFIVRSWCPVLHCYDLRYFTVMPQWLVLVTP